MAADGSVIIQIDADDKKFTSKLQGLAGGAVKSLTASVAAAAAAVTGLAAAAAKVGSEFESTMAATSTMFGDVAVDTDGLNAKILELSNSTGVAAGAIGSSLYNALSAGIPVTEDMGAAMDYMESCTQLAKAGFTDVDTAVTATAKILNAYGMDVSEVGDVHKILMQTQNKGITTVNELGASLAQVTPTAAAMKVGFDQVGAALANMTAAGTPTAQATTQLNALFAELGKSGTTAQKGLDAALKGTEYAGKSFQDLMADGVPLNTVLDLMGDYAEDNGKGMLDMFSSIEGGKAALALAGENSAKFTENLAAMSTEADVVGDAFDKVTDTLENRMDVLKESVKNLGIAVYDGMETPLKDAAGAATDMVGQITQAFATGGLEGAVGAVGGVLAQIITAFASAAPSMMGAGVQLVQSLLAGIRQNAPAIASGAAGVLAGLVSGIVDLLPQLADTAATLLTELGNQIIANAPQMIPAAVQTVAALVENLTGNLSDVIGAGIQVITALIEGLIAAIPDLIAYVPEIVSNIANVINDNAPKLLLAAATLILELGKGLIGSIPTLVQNIPKIITAIVDVFTAFSWITLGTNIVAALKNGITAAKSMVQSAAGDIVNTVKNGFAQLPQAMLNIGKSIVQGLWNGIKSAGSWLTSQIKSFVGGIVSTAKDVLGIHSPSRVFAEIGGYMAQGVGQGFTGRMDKVSRDILNAMPVPAVTEAGTIGNTEFGREYAGIAEKFQQRAAGIVEGESQRMYLVTAGNRGADSRAAPFDPAEIITEIRSLKAEVSKGGDVYLDERRVGRLVKQQQNRDRQARGCT